MTTDTKAAERLALQLAATSKCPPAEERVRGCEGLGPCPYAEAVACWLGWARRDDEADEKAETGGGRR